MHPELLFAARHFCLPKSCNVNGPRSSDHLGSLSKCDVVLAALSYAKRGSLTDLRNRQDKVNLESDLAMIQAMAGVFLASNRFGIFYQHNDSVYSSSLLTFVSTFLLRLI